MTVYVVTWNLNKERGNYDAARRGFVEHLERYDNVKDGGLESVRFISTTSSAQQVSDFLRQKLDENDRVFVSQLVKKTYAGWLSKSVWEWISARE